MSANGHATRDLRPREQRLVELYPWIEWLEPQPVTVAHPLDGSITRLTCRFCTALRGVKGLDLLSGERGFADGAEHARHLAEEHSA